jgi:glycosyltransferase involved in cell wall biosynthesis
MTIAALVVTHQSQDWIGATLESILNQTQPVDRVVLVDDGSTDRTRSIARAACSVRACRSCPPRRRRRTRLRASPRTSGKACGPAGRTRR